VRKIKLIKSEKKFCLICMEEHEVQTGECESICVNGITHHFFGNNKNTLLHVEDRAPVETDLSAT
jgi:hypothetical protein